MEINLELLFIQNPWWSAAVGQTRPQLNLKFDPVIEAYSRQTLKWRPPVLGELDLSRDAIYLLYGSRSVGKTTAMKLLIKELIEERRVEADNIFYYSCLNLDSYEQLNELVKIFLNWRAPSKPERLFIFIDEISLIKNWQKGFDFLYQAGKFKKATLILSGSSLGDGDLKKKYITNKIITSLDFGEFLALINPQLNQRLNKKSYANYQEQLDYYLDIYFLTGGFLSAINDFKNYGAVRQAIYSNYFYWLIADLAKLGRSVTLARQILEKIIVNLGEPIGYQTLARRTKAKTHLTVAEYLDILENMFAVKMVYQSEQGEISTSKAKKIYFSDPFIFWLFYAYIHGSLDYWRFSREHLHREDIFSALVENVVFSHLIKGETLADWGRRVTYWRDNIKKQEINFLIRQGKITTPILIRYNGEAKATDKNIFQPAGFKEGIIISREELKVRDKIKILPLTYFLLFYRDLI